MSTTPSSLSWTADRSTYHLRFSAASTGWGGDETPTLTVISDDLALRVEWAEGRNTQWDVWCFDADADIQTDDIILIEDEDLVLPLLVTRVTSFTGLRGGFHHYEILTEEHELSVAELKTDAGI